ncbi:MAG: YbeD family protein [Granulosicoccus sp.]
MSQETLIEFPAQIAVKAMGLNQDDFGLFVEQLVAPVLHPEPVIYTALESSGGKYLSVSIRFTASSLEQLHGVYAVLRAESRILYTL